MLTYLLTQALFFSLCFGYFSRRIVPFSVSLAFVVCLLVFSIGVIPGLAGQNWFAAIFSSGFLSGNSLHISFEGSLSLLFAHAFVGSFLGLVVSIGAYIALLVESWLSLLLFGQFRFMEEEPERNRFRAVAAFRVLFPLLALVAFFSGPSAGIVFQTFASSYLLVSKQFAVSSLAGSEVLLPFELVVGVLGNSLMASFVVMIPFFLVAFVIDLVSFFYKRVFLAAFSPDSVVAAKLTLLLLLLAFSLYPLKSRISAIEQRSVVELAKRGTQSDSSLNDLPLMSAPSDVR